MTMHLLEDLEKDILRESLNLGVGRAAAALSELIGHEVEIFLPELELLPKRTAVDLLSEKFNTTAWAVRQYFHHEANPSLMAGHIFLFLQDRELDTPFHKLIISLEQVDPCPLSEAEIIQEIGNIVLHACLSGLADLLVLELQSDAPVVHYTDLRPLLLGIVRHGTQTEPPDNRRRPDHEQDPVIQLLLHFETQESALDGAVMIFLDLITIPHLKQALTEIAFQYG